MAQRISVTSTVVQFAMMNDRLQRLLELDHVPARLSLRAVRNIDVLEAGANAFLRRQAEFLNRFGQRGSENELLLMPGTTGFYQIEQTPEATEAAEALNAAGLEQITYDLEPLELADFQMMESRFGVTIPSDIVRSLKLIVSEPSEGSHPSQED